MLLSSCKPNQSIIVNNSKNLLTPFEKKSNYSANYQEIISTYKKLAASSPYVQLSEYGMTDIGKPLHEVIVSTDGNFNPETIHNNEKAVLFINNGIHAGEPCGIDATMMLVRDIATGKIKKNLLQDIVLVIIPVYNIGGCLNRSSTSRANQNGPSAYGFRGNAQNLDLNRDFIKCDSKNASSFNQLFTKWQPQVFIDNHTSNGADYSYTMTLIATQKDKLSKPLAKYLEKEMLPDLYSKMKKKKWEMTPYVYAYDTPDKGIIGFLDLPRYSSGYAALKEVISFMPETHMLKPYKDRVWSTYAFMQSMIEHIHANPQAVLKAKKAAISKNRKAKELALNWSIDREKTEDLKFKGYAADYKESAISGHSRLYYDRNKAFNKNIPFNNTYKETSKVAVPKKYILPYAYSKVVDRLKWNGVKIDLLPKDTILSGKMYYITDYSSSPRAYEGHFLHKDVEVEEVKMKRQYYKGDYIIYTDQEQIRYIVESLEPQGPDSFFAWNFFDGILMQKEHFSAYVFEDLAVEILKKDKKLKKDFEEKKKNDAAFAENPSAQLTYIYKRSPHYEKTYQLYPVMRVF